MSFDVIILLNAMNKILILISAIIISTFTFSQGKIGGYVFGSNTAIHNSANREGNLLYEHLPTFSGGASIYYSKAFTDRKFGNRMLHGRRMSSFQSRWHLRLGLMYSAHNQKFKSTYRVLSPTSPEIEKEGKKRLDHLKLYAHIQHSYPFFNSKKLDMFWYMGLQGAYMLRARGGLVTWLPATAENNNSDNNVVQYYDLPPIDRDYYKNFVFEYAVGFGLEYHVSRWVNLTFTGHFDWSITTIENNDIYIYNSDPNHSSNVGIYERGQGEIRGDSRTTLAAFGIGAEYTFHRPEHARAKF